MIQKNKSNNSIMVFNSLKAKGINKLWLLLLMLLVLISGCSTQLPIEKYKASVNDKDIRNKISVIEKLKDNLLTSMGEEQFIDSDHQMLDDMSKKNKELKESLNNIKIKDNSIKALHNNIEQYANNNDTIITKSYELLSLYQSLLDEQDKDKIQEIYTRIVQTARSIDTISLQTNSYKQAWEEGLVQRPINN